MGAGAALPAPGKNTIVMLVGANRQQEPRPGTNEFVPGFIQGVGEIYPPPESRNRISVRAWWTGGKNGASKKDLVLIEMRYSRGEIFSHLGKFCLLQHARSRAARLCSGAAGRACRIVRGISFEQT